MATATVTALEKATAIVTAPVPVTVLEIVTATVPVTAPATAPATVRATVPVTALEIARARRDRPVLAATRSSSGSLYSCYF